MGIHWFIIVTFAVLLIQHSVYTRWGLKNVGYTRFFNVEAAFEGDEVYMVEKISNMKLLPLPWLRLESMIDASLKFQKQFDLDIKHGQHHKSLFSLNPYMRVTRHHRVQCTKRGCYFLNSAVITCGDAFESAEVSREVALSVRLLVYPRPIPLAEIPIPSHSWQGDVVVRRWIVEDPFMISGVREYCWGDPLNRINWKATARVGRFQVHNMDHTANSRLMIYLNFDISEDMWDAVTDPGRIEKGITWAASIARHAISQGVETGFGCNGYTVDRPGEPVRVPPRCGDQQLTAIFETMAKLVIARSSTFRSFLEQDLGSAATNTDFLFVTPYVSREMEIQVKTLQGLGNAVEILELPAEEVERHES